MPFLRQFMGNPKTGPIACPICDHNILSNFLVLLDDRPSMNEFHIVYFNFWQSGHCSCCDDYCVGLEFVDRLTGYG